MAATAASVEPVNALWHLAFSVDILVIASTSSVRDAVIKSYKVAGVNRINNSRIPWSATTLRSRSQFGQFAVAMSAQAIRYMTVRHPECILQCLRCRIHEYDSVRAYVDYMFTFWEYASHGKYVENGLMQHKSRCGEAVQHYRRALMFNHNQWREKRLRSLGAERTAVVWSEPEDPEIFHPLKKDRNSEVSITWFS